MRCASDFSHLWQRPHARERRVRVQGGEENHDDTKLTSNGRTVIPKFSCKDGDILKNLFI